MKDVPLHLPPLPPSYSPKYAHGSMVDFEERKRGILTTGEWCNPDSNMCKKGWVGIRNERFENGGSVLSRHPGLFILDSESYHRRHAVDALPSGHPFSRLIRHAGKWWAYSIPRQQGDKHYYWSLLLLVFKHMFLTFSWKNIC